MSHFGGQGGGIPAYAGMTGHDDALRADWIPAYAGMTWRIGGDLETMRYAHRPALRADWIPACAGMTMHLALLPHAHGDAPSRFPPTQE